MNAETYQALCTEKQQLEARLREIRHQVHEAAGPIMNRWRYIEAEERGTTRYHRDLVYKDAPRFDGDGITLLFDDGEYDNTHHLPVTYLLDPTLLETEYAERQRLRQQALQQREQATKEHKRQLLEQLLAEKERGEL